MQPETKLSQLRAHMEAGEWEKAIAIAARFPRLGAIRNAVLDAICATCSSLCVRLFIAYGIRSATVIC